MMRLFRTFRKKNNKVVEGTRVAVIPTVEAPKVVVTPTVEAKAVPTITKSIPRKEPMFLHSKYEVAPTVAKLVSEANITIARENAENLKAEAYKKQLITRLMSEPKYKDKVSVADMQSEKLMLAKMELIDAQEVFTQAQQSPRETTDIETMFFNNNSRTTTEPVFYCPSKQWYAVRNVVGKNARVFIKSEVGSGAITVSGVGSFVGLVHRTQGSSMGGNPSVVGNRGGSDLSETEWLSIISQTPSFENLARTFYLQINPNVTVDMSSIIPLW